MENKSIFIVSNGEEPIYVFTSFDLAKIIAEMDNLIYIDELLLDKVKNQLCNSWKYINKEWVTDF